ncbi:hypothetical protein ACFYTQ_26215 [Nocardia sp. NPDC004068]|uniref:hypothetical protein n=1 Tax=Nocardia sp. NPDC004068 TaxID=3364303 RepID=UPI003678350B
MTPVLPGAERSTAVAVLITPGLIQHHDNAELRARTNAYEEIVPVSFLEGSAPVYDELSQIIVRQLGIDEAAHRIGLIVRYGGRTIVGWQRLADQAIKWHAEGTGLLRGSEIAAALAVTHSETARGSSHRDTVLAYIEASGSAVTRRRRLWSTALTSIAIVLTVVLTVALAQSISARRAQLAADRAADRADADRLARVATSLIDADPDLPSILATTAHDLAPTDLTSAAVAQTATRTWPHTSTPVGYRPRTVTGARHVPRFAVGESDKPIVHVYQVVAGGGANEVSRAEVPVSRGLAVEGFLSPNGTTLATTEANPGTIRVFDVGAAAANPPAWVTGDDRLFGWIDDDRLLVGRGDRLLGVDRRGGSETLLTDSQGRVFDEANVSNNGRFIVAATEESLTRADLRHELPNRTAAVKHAGDVAINNTGDLAAAVTLPLATTVTFGPDTASVDELKSFYLSNVEFVTDRLIYGGGRNGTFSLFFGNEHSAPIRAHLDGSVFAALADGRSLMTTGNDGYLRIWNLTVDPGAKSYVSRTWKSGPVGLSDDTGVVVAPRLSARNQIRFATSTDVVVTGLSGYATVLDAATLQEIEPPERRRRREAGKCSDCAGIPGYFSGLFSELALSRNGDFLASVNPPQIWINRYSEQSHYFDGAAPVGISARPPRVTREGGEGVGAVSEDGKSVVVADDSVVATISAGTSPMASKEYPVQRRPVGLFAGGASPGVAITFDGYARDSAGTETRLPLPAGTELAACEIPTIDDYTCVTTQGRILRIIPGRASEIGSVGDGFAPFAIRVSPDTRRIAVIGRSGVSLVDLGSGARSFTPTRIDDQMITDVAFSPSGDRVLAVRVDGTVVALGRSEPTPPPRALTPEEVRLVDVPSGAR